MVTLSTLEKQNNRMQCEAVNLMVKGLDSPEEIQVPVYTRSNLNISCANMARQEDVHRYEHLRDLDLPVTCCNQVSILIGQNVPQALMPLEIRAGTPGDIYAVKTVLGSTLNGPVGYRNSQHNFQASTSYISDVSDVVLEDQVKQFW